MLAALRFAAYDFFWTKLSVIQENFLGFLFRQLSIFCQRSDAYSDVTSCKNRIRLLFSKPSSASID
jgi:hypothetical protein